MRTVRKILLPDILCWPVSPLFYAADGLLAWWAVEQMKVDRVYLARKRWNPVECSLGTPIMQTCIDALMTHFSYSCRYLRRRTRQQAKTL